MHLLSYSRRRLIGAAAIACGSTLRRSHAQATPPPADGAAASPAAPAVAASTPGCATSGLVVWLNTNGDGYAGGADYTLNFTNLSGHRCNLRGYPGVSATNLSGGQLGTSAGWGGEWITAGAGLASRPGQGGISAATARPTRRAGPAR